MPKAKTKAYVAEYVHQSVIKLADMGLAFVTPLDILVEQMFDFGGTQLSHFSTRFRRIETETVSEYTHPTPVRLSNVFNGDTIIAPDNEKKDLRREYNTENRPRGVDSNGNRETSRFNTLLQLFPKIAALFKFKETIRGSLVDIIATSQIDSDINFGLQIATAESSKGYFFFGKTVEKVLQYLNENLVVLLIGMVENQVAGVYMIPPTPSVKAELAKFDGATRVVSRMLNKYNTKALLNIYIEQFRYISTSFKDDVKGDDIKDFDNFSTDFLKLCDNYPYIVNTSKYLSSLFTDANKRTEWAGNTSFEIHVADVLGITQTPNHGERGDMFLDFGEFQLLDERKTLLVNNVKKTNDCWKLDLRNMGKQGLDPSKVRIITAFIRSDRTKTCPDQPDDFIAFIMLPVITASGHLALRPDKPESHTLCMNCDITNQSEYVEIKADKIGVDIYPNQTTEGSTTRIKAVFYYSQLTPGSERLTELQQLYRLFAERTPSEDAIQAYTTTVTDELIDRERKRMARYACE